MERSPKPDLWETRHYFYRAFMAFLEKQHKVHCEHFLTLAEDYQQARTLDERMPLAAQLLERFLDPKSSERLNFHPAEITAVRERHTAGLRAEPRALPDDLFEAFRLSVAGSLADLLPDFHHSEPYLDAAGTPNGVLWRVLKLSRLVCSVADVLQERAVQPFLTPQLA